MATAALVSSEEVCNVPFLIRKLSCTGGQTPGTITHGGPAAIPSMILQGVSTEANAAGGLAATTSVGTTTFSLTTHADNDAPFDLYVVWFNQAAGGISA